MKPTWDPGRAGWQERCEAGKFHAGGKLGLTSSAHLAPRPRVMTVVGRSGSGLLEVPGNRQRQASALPMLSGPPSLQASAHAKESRVDGIWGGERPTMLTPLSLWAADLGRWGLGVGGKDN